MVNLIMYAFLGAAAALMIIYAILGVCALICAIRDIKGEQ